MPSRSCMALVALRRSAVRMILLLWMLMMILNSSSSSSSSSSSRNPVVVMAHPEPQPKTRARATATATALVEKATASCLIAMLRNNGDGNLYLNATEFHNWVLDVADGCLTEQDLVVSSSSPSWASLHRRDLYDSLWNEIVCRCNEYKDEGNPVNNATNVTATTTTTTAVPQQQQQQVPCLPCPNGVPTNTTGDSNVFQEEPAAASSSWVMALPGIFPLGEYPGSYALQACDNVTTFIVEACVLDSATVLPWPSNNNNDNDEDADDEEEVSQCLIALLANNVNGDAALNYTEFVHWIVDLGAGCSLSEEDVLVPANNETFRQMACLCNNYTSSASSFSAPLCVSCQDTTNNSNPTTAAIALPGYYPPGEYPGGYSVAVCRQALRLVQDLCPTPPTNVPTSSPVLSIIDTAPTTTGENTTALDRNVDDAENEDSTGSTSSSDNNTGLILGLVIPLGALAVLGAVYWARRQQQQQHHQPFRSPLEDDDDDDENRPALDAEVGALPMTTKPWNNSRGTKSSQKQQQQHQPRDEASETELMTEDDGPYRHDDRTLPLSPGNDSLLSQQQSSESQTYHEQGAQLDLVVLPSDVKQQLDELNQAAPFVSSTMRLQAQALLPPQEHDDASAVLQGEYNNDKDADDDADDDNNNDDDPVSAIVATSVASSSSLKKETASGFFSRSDKKTPDAKPEVQQQQQQQSNRIQDRFNPVFKLFAMGSTSSLKQQPHDATEAEPTASSVEHSMDTTTKQEALRSIVDDSSGFNIFTDNSEDEGDRSLIHPHQSKPHHVTFAKEGDNALAQNDIPPPLAPTTASLTPNPSGTPINDGANRSGSEGDRSPTDSDNDELLM